MAEAPSEPARMCKEIVRISEGGQECTFGDLCRDDLVEQRYEALLGTLKAARKKGFLTFAGELLLMGQHNDTVIALTAQGVEVAEGIPEEAMEVQAMAPGGDDGVAAEASEEVAAPQEEMVGGGSPSAAVAPEPREDFFPRARGATGEDDAVATAAAAAAAEAAQEPAAALSQPPSEQAQAAEAAPPPTGTGAGGGAEEDEAVQEPAEQEQAAEAAPPPTGTVAAGRAEEDEGCPGSPTLSAGSPKGAEDDRKWKVDTAYIDHRTADPNRLEGRRLSAQSGSSEVVGSVGMTRKESDGKWKVDTSYINHRTAEVENLEAKQAANPPTSSEGGTAAAPSSTVRKDSEGKWKVDTAYIGYRTGDTANLQRNQLDTDQGSSYADPTQKKYSYEELKGSSNRPEDVDPKCKELYMKDDEFLEIFGSTFDDFAKLPKWKQQNLKRAKDVF